MRQPLRTVSEGKLCAGFSPSSDACSTSMRWEASFCCQGVKMLCRGRKKSKKPAGRSRVGSNGSGAVTRLTGLPISDAVAVIRSSSGGLADSISCNILNNNSKYGPIVGHLRGLVKPLVQYLEHTF